MIRLIRWAVARADGKTRREGASRAASPISSATGHSTACRRRISRRSLVAAGADAPGL